VANFTGAEAEELRRAVGMRRSWERMKNLESKLRTGMAANGMDVRTQDKIVQQISSFALYGFPESHAASFALIAYASAYFKVKFLAAFTCARRSSRGVVAWVLKGRPHDALQFVRLHRAAHGIHVDAAAVAAREQANLKTLDDLIADGRVPVEA